MPCDLGPAHLSIIREILRRTVPGHEVWAFGSRARGTAREASDLDLAIVSDTALDFETLAALRDAFSESDLPFKVDVVDWASTSESFRQIIASGHVVVQEGRFGSVGKATGGATSSSEGGPCQPEGDYRSRE